MMMKNMKKLSLAVIAISTAMLSTSCLREENFGKTDSKFISLKVSTEGIAETKAGRVAEPLEVVDLSQDGLDLFLYGSVKVNKMSPFGPTTKAASPYVSADADGVTKFDIQMNDIAGYANREVREDYWYIYKLGTEEKLTWDSETDPSHYLAYYPENAAATFATPTTINYTNDGSQDLLVAYVKHSHVDSTYPSSDKNYVPLVFKHPLALIQFNVVSSENNPISVDKIEINNAGLKGIIDGEDFLKSTISSYGTIEATYNSTDKVYSCYIMPDAIGADGLNVTFYVNGKILTTKNLGTTSWDAGYIYNYTLSNTTSDGDVNIELSSDQKDAESIVVENITNTTLWLRAAIIANRVYMGTDGKNRIVELWDKTVEIGDDWKFNTTDGYYYFQKPVIGYQAAEALIKSIPSYDGTLGLQIGVAVQAIEYDGTKTPEAAFAALN